MTHADGSTRAAMWDGVARWKRYTHDGPSEAVRAELHTPQLDLDPLDDGLTNVRDPQAALTYGAHAVYWIETLLQLLGGLL